jgi:hypothetical protein
MDIAEVIGEVKRRQQDRMQLESSSAEGEAEADVETLLLAASALQNVVELRQQTNLMTEASAVEVLLREIRLREIAVLEREERVWGWRILVADTDEAMRKEIAVIEARERELRQAEVALQQREVEVALRERAVEQKQLLLREEASAQAQRMKAMLLRAEKKASLTS